MQLRRLFFTMMLGMTAAFPAVAEEVAATKWNGSGELGLSSASGNSRSQNLNAQLAVGLDDGRWHHNASAFWLRNRGEVKFDGNGDGVLESTMQDTANRYGLAFSSAYDFSPRSYLVGAVRYDHDRFASFLWRGVAAVGYGYRWYDDDRLRLLTEIGPGFRRSHDAYSGRVENEAVGRGLADLNWKMSDNTRLLNTFLVESGRLNTFIQNDLGVQVSMTDRLALKVGYQVRYNSKVEPGFKTTDTTTMLNLVYSLH